MSKTGAERQAALKARRKAQGMVRRPLWATPDEHEKVREFLQSLRESQETPSAIKSAIDILSSPK